MFDTIAAISTGSINQPISIIRVSGSDSFDIVKKIFKGKVGNDKTITYGYIMDGTEIVDEVLLSWFKGPKTFTGENVVEINAHGGVVNSQKILRLILANGARMAENGEFSRRAFLNGKIDLVKAESIHELIFAKTEEQAKLAVKKFDGKTSKLINTLKDKLLTTIATIETNIDYPEYDDVEQLTKKSLLPNLEEVKKDIDEILDSSKMSKYIFDGVNVVIVGKPNVGKSSLLNAFLNEDKAIVTNIPGTTRDIVEGQVQVGQVLFKFKDTAGIHKTEDKVEKLGVNKSKAEIKEADLIIHVVDPTQGEDPEIEKIIKGKNYIKVYNKNDIKKSEGISISAKNKNIDELLDAIKDKFKEIDLSNNKIINNTRQLSLIDLAKNNINDAIKGLQDGVEPSIVIVDIQEAWNNIANILGRADQEDLLDNMFSNFCLGK